MSIAVCVSTYGPQSWADLARSRALPSCEGQGADEVVFTHMPEGSVALARNLSASRATADWLIFLDADDELADGYLAAMREAIAVHEAVTDAERLAWRLFTPAVSYVLDAVRQKPKFWPMVDFRDANWMVIGTMISRALFERLGGFRNYGDPPGSNAYEDWGLWALAQREGATVAKVPDAVYIAWVNEKSRHRGSDHETRIGWHYEIGRDLFPERYDEEWLRRFSRRARSAGRSTTRGRRA